MDVIMIMVKPKSKNGVKVVRLIQLDLRTYATTCV